MMTPQIAMRSIARLVGLIFVFSFFVNMLSMTLPLYMMQIFDRVVSARSIDTLIAITLIAVFLIGCYGLLEAIRSRIMVGIDGWLDRILFPRITSARLERAADAGREGIRGGLTELRSLRQFFSGQSVLAVLDTLWSPLFLVIGFLIHPVLGIIGGIGALGLVVLSVANELMTRNPQRLANLLMGRTTEQTESAVRTAEVVAALGMAPAILDHIGASADDAREKSLRATRLTTTFSGVTKMFRLLVQIAIMGVGIWLVLADDMTVGAVFAASMIMGRGLAPFEQMQRTWTTVVSARQSYRTLQDYLGAMSIPPSTISYPAPQGALSVEGVTFLAPGTNKPLVHGVSFALSPGEALGIVGPSAAGKSTLARLLVGIWRPTAGKVRLDGIDVSSWDRVDFGQHIGYVPQDVELLAGSVRQNIARFQTADDAEIIAAAQAANAHDLVVRLPRSYDTDVGEGGMLLSGGQRQRIALARALFRDPRYIVLDEPNSNLDSEGEAAMLEALQVARSRGATILIVAHRPSLLVFVDKLLLLKEGRMDAFGERQTMLSRLQPRPTVVSSAQSKSG